jgi:hypothetical protein
MINEIRVGDVVYLKSENRPATVSVVGGDQLTGDQLTVVWFDRSELFEATLPLDRFEAHQID